MIFKYIGDFSIDFSGAVFHSEGYGNEIQLGNALQVGDSPAVCFLLLLGREWENTVLI